MGKVGNRIAELVLAGLFAVWLVWQIAQIIGYALYGAAAGRRSVCRVCGHYIPYSPERWSICHYDLLREWPELPRPRMRGDHECAN